MGQSPYYDDPILFNVQLSTTTTTPTTFHYNDYISNHQNTLLSLLQHQCPIILIPLLHTSIQFAHWKQWQVVPFTISTYCYNTSTILLFLKLYLMYYILIFICLQQFVDCLQPQVATLSNPYENKIDEFSNIFTTTTTTKSTTLSSPYYIQLDVYSNIFKTTTTTKSTTKNPLFQYKKRCNGLNAFAQQLQTTLIPNTRFYHIQIIEKLNGPFGLLLVILLAETYAATFGTLLALRGKDKLFYGTSIGLLLVILLAETYAATFGTLLALRGKDKLFYGTGYHWILRTFANKIYTYLHKKQFQSIHKYITYLYIFDFIIGFCAISHIKYSRTYTKSTLFVILWIIYQYLQQQQQQKAQHSPYFYNYN